MSKGENMVERVARVFCEAEGQKPTPNNLAAASDTVRAIIEVLMEPTPEMVAAMEEAFFDSTMGTPLPGEAAPMYRAALRTALSQPKEEEGK